MVADRDHPNMSLITEQSSKQDSVLPARSDVLPRRNSSDFA